MKHLLLTVPILGLILLSACSSTEQSPQIPPTDTSASSSSILSEAPPSTDSGAAVSSETGTSGSIVPTTDTGASSSIAPTAAEPMHSITIDASNFAFTPNAITVKRGENVTLVLKDVSGTHGFAVPDLNIDVAMQEGDTKTIVLPTSTVGTFPFHCSIPCGPGHRDMTGQIVIE